MELVAILLLMDLIFGSEIKAENTEVVVKIEEDDSLKAKPAKSSIYTGVYYDKQNSSFCVQRWSKKGKKLVCFGYYKDETKAAHASDTLVRNLTRNGEKGHKLNFPDDDTEVYPEVQVQSFKYTGVFYHKRYLRWIAQRYSKKQKRKVYNGYYKNETKAAQASDTLARILMRDGEERHQLNFPDNPTEVHPEGKMPTSKYNGVYYYQASSRWYASRWSKKQKKRLRNGSYRCEREAALASDDLARAFMQDGEEQHQLNFTEEEYHQIHWETNHEINEKEGIYSKRTRYTSGNLGGQQEYLVYKME